MKTYKKLRRGFTLIELLTAVAITTVIIAVLIGMTRMTMDTWKESSQRARSAQQAKESLELLARDLEGIVIRNGNEYEWMYAKMEGSGKLGPSNGEIKNPIELGFFTAATDRYDGQIGVASADKGGDISTALYRLVYKDQLGGKFPVYALYRKLVNPDETFKTYLAQEDFQTLTPSEEIIDAENFLAENIYNLTVTFVFEEIKPAAGGGDKVVLKRVPVMTSGSDFSEVRVKGNEVLTPNSSSTLEKDARLVAVDLGVLVLSDSAMNVLTKKKFTSDEAFGKFVKENSNYYTKSVILPRP